jgi:hypothetical protein
MKHGSPCYRRTSLHASCSTGANTTREAQWARIGAPNAQIPGHILCTFMLVKRALVHATHNFRSEDELQTLGQSNECSGP